MKFGIGLSRGGGRGPVAWPKQQMPVPQSRDRINSDPPRDSLVMQLSDLTLLTVIGWTAIGLTAIAVVAAVVAMTTGRLRDRGLGWSLVLFSSGVLVYSLHFVLPDGVQLSAALSPVGTAMWVTGGVMAWRFASKRSDLQRKHD